MDLNEAPKEYARIPYTDADLCFYLRVGPADVVRSGLALERLRRYFPTARVMLVDDGTGAPEFDGIASRTHASLVRSSKLYSAFTQGRMWHQALELFLKGGPEAILIKIDADTAVRRRFKYLLDCPHYGTLDRDHLVAFPYIQGGCAFIQRRAAQALFDAQALLTSRYNEKNNWEPGCMVWLKDLNAEDVLCSAALLRLGFDLADFDEVYSMNNTTVIRVPDQQFAITHPHKNMAALK